MGYRILVTGSRDWLYRVMVNEALDRTLVAAMTWRALRGDDDGPVLTVVHGHCPTGADAQADEWALANAAAGVAVERHEVTPAMWKAIGRGAGPQRNARMVELGADGCLAFVGSCTSPRCTIVGDHYSHGATGCGELAEAAGIPTWWCRRLG